MKRICLIIATFVVAISINAQSWTSGNGTLYTYPSGTNVGIGVSNPVFKLQVNGKVFLHDVDVDSTGTYHSYLQWMAHKLTMGVPQGHNAHTILELMPGGSPNGELFSQLSLYQALNATQKEERIHLCSVGYSWINTNSNFGIGTTQPQYKLDVRGTIRANEILVNIVNGADFVFDDSYHLRPLSAVKDYIKQNQHLPEIPSAAEMQENGVNINEFQIQLLQKVEELTLYIIQQEQRIQELENQITK